MKKIILLALIFTAFFFQQGTTVIDDQNNQYKTIKIGSQTWMAENLKYNIPEGSCYYNNDSVKHGAEGRLYTYEAALKASGHVEGWRMPTKEEWDTLVDLCGKDSLGFFKITSKELGFNPQWAGARLASGKFVAKNFKVVNYWSSTPCDTNAKLAYSVGIMSNLKIISPHNYPRLNACSVRLIKADK